MEQRATIEKLKAATKYSTTQSLIEKYGGTAGATPTKDSKKSSSGGPKTPRSQRRHSQQQQQLQQLTITPDQLRLQQQMHAQGMPPPYPGQTPQSPQSQQALQSPYEAPNPQALQLLQGQTQPASRQHLQPEEASAPKWYDRILDVVLGEDEMSAKSRFALICKSCRMVNGLAPPGTRSLDDMDVWGCARCGAMNGGRKRGAGMLMPPESIAESELGSEFGDMTTAAPTPEPLLPAARMARSRSQSQAQQQLEESSASTDEEEVLLVKQEPDIAEFEEMSEATATDPKTPKSKRGGRMSAKSSETAN